MLDGEAVEGKAYIILCTTAPIKHLWLVQEGYVPDELHPEASFEPEGLAFPHHYFLVPSCCCIIMSIVLFIQEKALASVMSVNPAPPIRRKPA